MKSWWKHFHTYTQFQNGFIWIDSQHILNLALKWRKKEQPTEHFTIFFFNKFEIWIKFKTKNYLIFWNWLVIVWIDRQMEIVYTTISPNRSGTSKHTHTYWVKKKIDRWMFDTINEFKFCEREWQLSNQEYFFCIWKQEERRNQ